jgi:hypothetical protein
MFALSMPWRHTGGTELHSFLTSALDGDAWLTPCHGRFTVKETRYPLNRRLGWSKSWSSRIGEEKISPSGIQTPDHLVHSLVTIPTMLLWLLLAEKAQQSQKTHPWPRHESTTDSVTICWLKTMPHNMGTESVTDKSAVICMKAKNERQMAGEVKDTNNNIKKYNIHNIHTHQFHKKFEPQCT